MVLRGVLLVLCTAALTAEAARVLMLCPLGGKSQKNIFYGLGSALSERGHEVVFFNAFKPSTPVKGVKEVVPDKLAALFTDDKMPSQFKMNEQGASAGLGHFWTAFVESPREALHSAELAQLMQERFDVVILSAFSYSLYFVPHAMKVPYILMAPTAYFPIMSSPLGNPTLPSVVPIPFIDSTDEMTFLNRVKCFIIHGAMMTLMKQVFMPYCDRLVAEKFGQGAFPSAADIERNTSLVFLSGTEVTDYHQPLLPNTVLVGGMHCVKAQPLPKHISDFVGDSEFILFSLGSVARPEDMTKEQRKAVLQGLSAVPFKVLLKWNTTERKGMPDNVLPSKWLPQQDLLGHSRCRLFVSHGGFASILESLCHGVPTVVMPVTGDQFSNAANAKRLGVSETLYWKDLSAETLREKILKATTPEVLATAEYRRALLESRPIPSRDLAVYWVEHVVAYGGAPHLRSVAADLYWFQYYSLDVMLFLLVVLLVVLKVFTMTCKCCCRCLCGSKASGLESAKTTDVKSKKRAKRD